MPLFVGKDNWKAGSNMAASPEVDASSGKTGADLVAEFVARHCHPNAFLVTGGACAFIVDALGSNPRVRYTCFQHEQAAAMAADAVWRVSELPGVTVATSGPGATNLVTGIACSWFDSIPSLHITGQVNDAESSRALGVQVRQAGFQETDIVGIVTPITKFATRVHSVEELGSALRLALTKALEGRMGPVLVDVPMNVQKDPVPEDLWESALAPLPEPEVVKSVDWDEIAAFLDGADRPLVVLGAGGVLSGALPMIQQWCEASGIPFVASWGAMPHLDRSSELFLGSHGVYGSRLANWAVQASDKILVLGSRLDNRQRTGNPSAYAPFADLLVVDIDSEELKKYHSSGNYRTIEADLRSWKTGPPAPLSGSPALEQWQALLIRQREVIQPGTSESVAQGELSPYSAVDALQARFQEKSVVVADCGANLCWVYQDYLPDDSLLLTAAGNSPMGYSLPAAIGAQLAQPAASVWCFIGDGGLQMNIQELQTVQHLGLPIVIVILNNRGYGIIKQFQDAYFDSRYEATGDGYSTPDFAKIASAYGLDYCVVESVEEIAELDLTSRRAIIIDVMLPPGALITPKIEMDRFIHDQFPYTNAGSISELPFDYPRRPSEMGGVSSPNV